MVLSIEDTRWMPCGIHRVGRFRYIQVNDYCKCVLIIFWHLRRRRNSPKHEQLSTTICRVEVFQKALLIEKFVFYNGGGDRRTAPPKNARLQLCGFGARVYGLGARQW